MLLVLLLPLLLVKDNWPNSRLLLRQSDYLTKLVIVVVVVVVVVVVSDLYWVILMTLKISWLC